MIYDHRDVSHWLLYWWSLVQMSHFHFKFWNTQQCLIKLPQNPWSNIHTKPWNHRPRKSYDTWNIPHKWAFLWNKELAVTALCWWSLSWNLILTFTRSQRLMNSWYDGMGVSCDNHYLLLLLPDSATQHCWWVYTVLWSHCTLHFLQHLSLLYNIRLD